MIATTHTLRHRLGLIAKIAIVAALAFASTGLSASEGARCEVTIEPEVVAPGSEAFTVAVTPSQPIGTLVSAEIDEASAVQVAVVDAERQPEGHYSLNLDLSAATTGDWLVTLHGAHGDCIGLVRIEEKAASK